MLISIFTGCPIPGEELPSITNLPDMPTEINVTKLTDEDKVEISWEGNVNDGSYAIGLSETNVQITEADEIFFPDSNSTAHIYDLITDREYYCFWIIRTDITDNDLTAITQEMLNDAVYIEYRANEDPPIDYGYPTVNLYIENNSQYLQLDNEDVIASNSLNIKGVDLNADLRAYYKVKIDDGEWSQDVSISGDDENSYSTVNLNNEFGIVQINTHYENIDYDDENIITITINPKLTLLNVTLKNSNEEDIIDDSKYNEDIIIRAEKPVEYPEGGTYKVKINNSTWEVFSDNSNAKHSITIEDGEELEVTSVEIKYVVEDTKYESEVYLFGTSSNPINFIIDKIAPNPFNSLISNQFYEIEIQLSIDTTSDLNTINIKYIEGDDRDTILLADINDYQTFITLDKDKGEIKTSDTFYISSDANYINVCLEFIDDVGNLNRIDYKGEDIKKPASHLCVTPDGDSSNIGGTWKTATELQSAIDYAADNNIPEVWVKYGEYAPSQFAETDGTTSLYYYTLRAGVRVIGGFNGDENEIPNNYSFNNPNQTILVPYETSSILNQEQFHIIYNDQNSNLGSTTILERMILQNGNADAYYSSDGPNPTEAASGGAVFMGNTNSPTFINCKFVDNQASKSGGAVYLSDSQSKFINCIFENNITTHSYSPADFANNYIYGGGAIYAINSDIELIGCLFDNNYSATYGGAITLDGVSSIVGTNLTFLNTNDANLNENNALFIFKGASIGHSHIFYNTLIDPRNIFFNPQDTSITIVLKSYAASNDTAIDRGNNDYLSMDDYDINHNDIYETLPYDCYGNSRIVNSIVDIGAIEVQL